jgi:ATP-dependent DNA ligase
MTHLTILSDARTAGHCTSGTSNKVWAACLAVEQEEAQVMQTTALSSATEVVFLCVHGPHGAALRRELPQRLSLQAARTLLRKKWQEKVGKGYASVAFESFVLSFGRPFGLPLLLPGSDPSSATVPDSPVLVSTGVSPEATPAPWRYTPALVKAVSSEEMRTLLANGQEGTPSSHAVSEKANGERCLIEFDGGELRVYNRQGRLTSAPPEGARALCRLGHSFVIDGERLIREQAGAFVAFDVLEWRGESLLSLPYRLRLTQLVRGMCSAGLLKHEQLTPTLRAAWESSTLPDLCVLAVRGAAHTQAVIEEIQAAGGEGVVIRHLEAPYARGSFKYKFLEDIDVFVIDIEPGVSAGSLTLALVRPVDGAIIEVGHVRSGLTDQNVEEIRRLLAHGKMPVFTIHYLPASTIGITLVQPQTSMALLRSDKEARECTTDQFGPEKAALIAQARPVSGALLR